MRKISKFLMAGVLLLTGFLGITNTRNEVKEVEAAATFTAGETLYLQPKSSSWDWTSDGAKFGVHFFNSSTNTYDAMMKDNDNDGIYEVTVPSNGIKYDHIIFCRMNSTATSFDWSKVWNQTGDLAPFDSCDLFTITSESNGTWSKYYYNPKDLEVEAVTVENDEEINNAVTFRSALPKDTDAMKNGSEEYNVGLKFEFERTWITQEQEEETTKDVYKNVEHSSEYIILKPNANWTSSNAWFAVYHWSTGNSWTKMEYGQIPNKTVDNDTNGTLDTSKYYYIKKSVLGDHKNLVFCRMNSSNTTALNWNNVWNQTNDLTLPTNENNTYTVAAGAWSKGSGSWGKTTINFWEKTGTETIPGGLHDIPHSETYVGYYKCANISTLLDTTIEYDAKVYFAVTITNIPKMDYLNEVLTVKVTPAYQSMNGETIYGNSSFVWTLTFTDAGIVPVNN